MVTCRSPRTAPCGRRRSNRGRRPASEREQKEERDRRFRGEAVWKLGITVRSASPDGVSSADPCGARPAAGDHGVVRTVGRRGRTAGGRCRRPARADGAGGARGRRPPRRGGGRRPARPRRRGLVDDDTATAAHLVPELKAQQIELGTRVCRTSPRWTRSCASGAAAPSRPRPPSGHTSPHWPPHRSPWSRWRPRGSATPAWSTEFGLTAREMLTCGCHVHVSVDGDEEGVAVLNRIRIWLPVLTALTANSPFWQGADTGYASFRSQAWHRWPSAGPNEVVRRRRRVPPAGRRRARHRHRSRHRHGLLRRPPVGQVAHRRGAHRRRRAARRGRRHPGRARPRTGRDRRPGGARPAPAARRPPRAPPGGRPGAPAAPGSPATSSTPSPGRPAPAADVLGALLDHVRPALADAGDEQRIDEGLHAVLRRGTGADLQRRVHRETGRPRPPSSAPPSAITTGRPETAQATSGRTG